MIINLDSKHRIRSDKYSWRLEVENIQSAKVQWKALAHCSTFQSALLNAYRREIRMHHAEGLKDCIAAAEGILVKYKTVLDNFQLEETT